MSRHREECTCSNIILKNVLKGTDQEKVSHAKRNGQFLCKEAKLKFRNYIIQQIVIFPASPRNALIIKVKNTVYMC